MAFFIVMGFFSLNQDIPCGDTHETVSSFMSCDQSQKFYTEVSTEKGLAKRPNMTHRQDSSVCESCHSGWCKGLVFLSRTLFSDSYTLAQSHCFEPGLQFPVDPFLFPPREQKTTPKVQKAHPFLSNLGIHNNSST